MDESLNWHWFGVCSLSFWVLPSSGKKAWSPRTQPQPHFSLDLFLPIANLQVANLWVPKKDRRFARNYVHIHKILGALLVPIGLAAVTGIIK
jgi:hypothetical protein